MRCCSVSAWALARGMATFVYGIPAIDPVTFLGVPAFMLAITFIAGVFQLGRQRRLIL
jgi:hypothetical protein